MIIQALLLVTKQAEPIKGLLTAVHSFVSCCPFLHSPVPLQKIWPEMWPPSFHLISNLNIGHIVILSHRLWSFC